MEQIKHIVEIQLGLLRKRLAERKLTLTLTEAAEEAVALAGYDPVYGARPLKRAIQKQIADPLAQRCWPASSAKATTSSWMPTPKAC